MVLGAHITLIITPKGYEWRSAAENVAYGMSGARSVMHGWMNSEGHRANIMADNIHMGIAFSPEGKFWAQVFGTPQAGAGEGCDVETPGGQLGSLYATKVNTNGLYVSSGQSCVGVCDSMVDRINAFRRGYGKRSVCVSGKLMVVTRARISTHTHTHSQHITLQNTHNTRIQHTQHTHTHIQPECGEDAGRE